MLYSFIKIIARLALPIYCRDIAINRKEYLDHKGPLLLAANHPNSFLDAIILCTLFDRPVYSLARGDAFKKRFFARLLHLLKMFPVYRVSEGVENLEENYKTFEQCKNIFKQNGIVLIFSEGRCINEWHLRPLKKGTARLAISSWEEGIDLEVLPVAINYSSFKKFGKNLKLYFGNVIKKEQVDYKNSDGIAIRQFNEILKDQLQKYVYEVDKNDSSSLKKKFHIQQPFIKKIILFTPAVIGLLIHFPLYYLVQQLSININKEPGHYDSKIVGLFFIIYPAALLLTSFFFLFLTGNWLSLFLLILFPFSAWSYVQLKRQLD